MTRKIFTKLALITTMLIYPPAALSGHGDLQHEEANAGIELSGDLKAILIKEMRLIEKGMASLTGEIARGNWQNITQIATKMKKSYILKQELSKDQIEELHHKLPEGFRELDHNFHKMAGMLAHVAEERHSELVAFYFYKLTESCMSCHAKYAGKAFPNFNRENVHNH